jgi:hypothetical protein
MVTAHTPEDNPGTYKTDACHHSSSDTRGVYTIAKTKK